MADYEVIIGLEFHIQLLTNSKLFSSARNGYENRPNTNVDDIDIALPGTLPVINSKAVEFAIKLGLALNCKFNTTSIFSRKHYFYPDLPKGYQITQHDLPICEYGNLNFPTKNGIKAVEIERIHIEEDSGKSLHMDDINCSYCDYNRAGIPLLEVVTRPDLRSAEEAMDVYKALRTLVIHLDICDGNMQEGSIRADANVSIRKHDEKIFGIRTEIKNINSVKFLGQAINHEFHRQILKVESGQRINRETRLWDSHNKISKPLRDKETILDYRYFPDPDLPPLIISESRIRMVHNLIQELPIQKQIRYQEEFQLTANEASILISNKVITLYFEQTLKLYKNAKNIANWIINEMQLSPMITIFQLAQLIRLIDDKIVTTKIARYIYEKLLNNQAVMPIEIVADEKLEIQHDCEILQEIIKKIIINNPTEVQKYKSGKTRVFEFLMGQVIKNTRGVADPNMAKTILKEYLDQI